ncbi:hypothetical protein AVEN_84050-1 [Araneus ventricosus]|uniref:Uncharacterized protein n=1 Tax=Araneus ventricosus TaxID=182803 RepID=A0A4Y2W6Y6_ARAVE|nr:hypothetical protein AVEN_84050-1 [Araneus ventricosus]
MVVCVNGAENLKTGKPMFMMKRDKDASLSQQMILFNEFSAVYGAVRWDASDHLAYSTDLVTSDFLLFLELKNWAKASKKRRSFKAMLRPISHHWRQFFEEGIENLVYRYDKCLIFTAIMSKSNHV